MEETDSETEKISTKQKMMNCAFDSVGSKLEDEVSMKRGRCIEKKVLNNITSDEMLNLLNYKVLSDVLCMVYGNEVMSRCYKKWYLIICQYPYNGSRVVFEENRMTQNLSEVIRGRPTNCMLPESAIRTYIFNQKLDKR
ncbi:hypothetical protein TorRG33x02_344590 [Trema orientale]|uniref:Uncharacterized protein n=1 Tax=Trema orientale TaxID=63057 RepID=A0A2P5APZ5_TREOI|nr:hypothetical protein TorRG33x02_344590 [Trema orientale]